MPTTSDPVPPVPNQQPILQESGDSNKITIPWSQWFQQLRTKINVLNESIVALASVTGSGILTKVGAAWVLRTIAGTARITVTNGAGTAGNPTIDLAAGAGTSAQFLRGDNTWSNELQGSITFRGAVINNDFKPAAVTALVNTQSVMGIGAYGGNGTADVILGTLNFRAGENWTGSANGGDFAIRLITYGTTTLAERWRIKGDGSMVPGADNVQTNGSASLRWSVVYAGTGAINTSDAREKTAVRVLSNKELKAATAIAKEIGSYQWLSAIELKGAHAREHIGITVQRAMYLMEVEGLDPFRYGFICYDEWDAIEESTDDEGVVQPYVPAGSRYSFRMDELNLFIAAGFNARLQALEVNTGAS